MKKNKIGIDVGACIGESLNQFDGFDTVYAIELNARVYIPTWEKEVRIMLEEAGYFGTKGFRYVNGRQKKLLLVGKKQSHLE